MTERARFWGSEGSFEPSCEVGCDPGSFYMEVDMKQIANKEYEAYQQYQTDKMYGRVLTPDGLRLICAGLDNDPEKIGIHMLEMLANFRNEGIVE